jgi:AraC family transcriptional regulator of adaptative response / DNA-3-methyladenine glycosylase II
VQRFGPPIETPFAGVTQRFPDAQTLANCAPDEIASLGIIAARARAIVALARTVDSGELVLAPGVDVDRTVQQLLAVPGIGAWTAQAIAMRSLHWPDAFPAGDIGVSNALNKVPTQQIARLAERWQPWRAYAVLHLWTTLEEDTR